MNRTGQTVKLRYSINGKLFHYRGKIISEDEIFIEIDDIKGRISLNKTNILSIELLGDL